MDVKCVEIAEKANVNIMIIAVDFDGTIVEHEYPSIGAELPHCRRVLKALIAKNHQIILYTMRDKKELNDAVEFVREHMQIPLYGINTNPQQREWTSSPKAYAQIYIDDAALGVPLIYPVGKKRPFVNWLRVEELLRIEQIL